MRKFFTVNFTAKILNDQIDIFHAQQLLYQTYVVKQKWLIPKDNLSGIRIKNISNENILVDDYDQFSTWIGAFDDKKLIACGRIVERDIAGLLEIERYSISDKLRSELNLFGSKLIELNRSAIQENYRNTVVWPYLLHYAFKYCDDHDLSAIATTGYQKVIKMHEAIGFKTVTGEEFKYYPTDEREVSVFLVNSEKGDVKIILRNLENIISKKSSALSFSPDYVPRAKF